MFVRATAMRRRTRRSGFVALALLIASGCQSTKDRPLLPLLGTFDEPTPIVRFGAPTSAIVQASAIQKPEHVEILPALGAAVPRALFAQETPIDLDGVLQQASFANPRIGLADELVRASIAERMLIRSFYLPTLNAGMTLSVHRGALLNSAGLIREINRESLYVGSGADVRGAGTVAIPGLQLVTSLSDAVFAPRLADQQVQRSFLDAAATQNSVLLAAARAYLELAGAEARLQKLKESEKELAELARLTADFANKGVGREADALRSQGEQALLRSLIHAAEEDIAVRSAEVNRLLSADPSLRLRPELGAPLVQMIDEDADLAPLVATALANRPELTARAVDVALSETRLRQERWRPLLPTIALGLSHGEFGGGSDTAGYRFSHFGGRVDLDVVAVWSLNGLGAGNRAITNRARIQVGIAEAVRMQTLQQVEREVAEAYARSQNARAQIDIARRRVEIAERAYRQDLQRTKDRLGRLIETLASFNLLVTARQDVVNAMVAYSQAQFELFTAIGEKR